MVYDYYINWNNLLISYILYKKSDFGDIEFLHIVSKTKYALFVFGLAFDPIRRVTGFTREATPSVSTTV